MVETESFETAYSVPNSNSFAQRIYAEGKLTQDLNHVCEYRSKVLLIDSDLVRLEVEVPTDAQVTANTFSNAASCVLANR